MTSFATPCSSRCKPFAPAAARRSTGLLAVQAQRRESLKAQDCGRECSPYGTKFGAALAALVVSLGAQPAVAKFRLPPLDTDPNRCERAYDGNTIGQANAVSDKVLDLRQCKYKGKNLSSKVLSGALISDADFSETVLRETVLTKAYAVGADFSGADMTSAVVDRVDFTRANLRGVKFVNAVITGSVFKDADMADVSFEDALVGGEDVKRICLNPTLKGESRAEIGCRT